MRPLAPFTLAISGVAYAVGLALMPPAWAVPMLAATVGGAVGAALAVLTIATAYRRHR